MVELVSKSQLRMSFLRIALFTIPAILLLGTLSGILSNSGDQNSWYQALQRPSFTPPGWAFPVVWTTLYILLGLSLAMILHARGARGRNLIVALFIVQLLMNFAWSPLFFGLHQVAAALVLVVVMIALALLLIVLARRIRPLAALLLVPYVAWLCLATALTYRILVDNPGASQVAPEASRTNISLD